MEKIIPIKEKCKYDQCQQHQPPMMRCKQTLNRMPIFKTIGLQSLHTNLFIQVWYVVYWTYVKMFKYIVMFWSQFIMFKCYNDVFRQHRSFLKLFIFDYLQFCLFVLYPVTPNPQHGIIATSWDLTYCLQILLSQIYLWLTLGQWFSNFNCGNKSYLLDIKDGFQDRSCSFEWIKLCYLGSKHGNPTEE